VLAEWDVLKDLVDRRTFSWTGLFARLEQVLPREVRLVSIAPEVERGQVTLEIVAVARPPKAGLGLVGVLEGRGEFEDVYPESVAEKEGGTAEFHYTMRYLPGVAAREPVPVPAAGKEAAGEEPADEPEPQPAAAPAPAPGATRPTPAGPPVPAPGPRMPPGKAEPEPREDDAMFQTEPEEPPN
jgi:hypothetical protein